MKYLVDSARFASLLELQTPHAVVDESRMERNLGRVAGYARAHQLGLRPHIKTHKDPAVAERQLAHGALGVTVATAREAEVMADVAKDILVAYPPVDPGRIARLAEIPEDISVQVALDSEESVSRLSAGFSARRRGVARERGVTKERGVGVLVEVDLGAKRTGVTRVEDVITIAQAAARARGTTFEGLMVHPGHLRGSFRDPTTTDSSAPESAPELETELRRIDERIKEYVKALAAAGLDCATISGGNTPTLFSSHLMTSLTEIRPGTYVYCDRDIASQGVFAWEDCAYSVLATVVSVAVPGQAVVDAGTKAIGREPVPGLSGYGALLDRPEVVLCRMSEEHGILDLSDTDWRPEIGDRVRIVPNHVCISVHLQDHVAFVSSGDLSIRPVAARGRSSRS